MDERRDAEEHLRVIRSLMERATVYRAISAPTAVVGGALSLLTSAFLFAGSGRDSTSFFHLGYPGAAHHFITIWLTVLVATLLANTIFIWRKARRESSAFFTSGLKLAIYSTAPVLIVTAVSDVALLAQRRNHRSSADSRHCLDHLLWPRFAGHREFCSAFPAVPGLGLPPHRRCLPSAHRPAF